MSKNQVGWLSTSGHHTWIDEKLRKEEAMSKPTKGKKARLGCPECNANQTVTGYNHKHNAPYGMEQCHMAGTERFECKECEYPLTRPEAEARGLVYVLDTEGGC